MQQTETYGFDARALTEPVDRRAVKAFKGSLSTRFPLWHANDRSLGETLTFVLFVAIGSVFVLVGLGAIASGIIARSPAWFAGLPFLLVGGVFVVLAIVHQVAGGATTAYRLDRFAQANNMTFHPGYSAPKLPGMLFGVGRGRRSNDLVRGDEPRFVEFGNYRYKTGSGKSEKTHTWGYIAVRLDAPLPHIVLDAEGNNGLFGSNLPIGFRKDQRLELEGDFHKHFSLYCPEGYEADALYLFTPDIMARFMDSSAQLDVEIVDDWLFFYTGKDVSTLDPRRWAWLFSVVGAMLDKMAQWGRWRDDRLRAEQSHATPAQVAPIAPDHIENPAMQNPATLRPPKGVADPGRRLKRRGFAWTGFLAVAIFVILQVLSQLD
ncbi:DUF3137 domain-containing protein [Microbacterium sp. G2-8]|uniref:DUF3137 domain-containing protein n=1 Tax=Microbacterium sp. G2-8 TaxID=2842454 RepID=UPI001C8A2F3B|nr:DUF3137 domain-containing protein [Microbacterium sp. G2-8]